MQDLQAWLDVSIGGGWECRLFTNNPEPVEARETKDRAWFVEPSYSDYRPIPLGYPMRWQHRPDGWDVVEFKTVTFAAVDATVYGWFIVESRPGGEALMFGQIGRSWRPKRRTGGDLRLPMEIDLNLL